MSALSQKFASIKDIYNQKKGKFQAIESRLVTCRSQVSTLTDQELSLNKASLFLQSLSDQARVAVLDKISGIVTDALQAIKDKNVEFKMSLNIERNQPTLTLNILDKQDGQLYDPLQSFGGGIADIISVVLRIALLVAWKPSLSRVLILDESAKHVAVADQELLAEFITKLSKSLGIQFIWITHSDVLTNSADRVFEIVKNNGISNVAIK